MATVSLMIGPDHRVPCNPQGGTATVVVDNTGGTVYWAESPQGSISNAEGSIAPGGTQVFSGGPVWLLASQLAGVQITVVSADDAGGSGGSLPASVGVGTPPSPTWLLTSWTLAGSFRLSSASRDSNGAITTASVVWPDGATGTFTTDTASTAFPGAIDAYHVTYVYGAGPTTRTITQTAVTRDPSTGAVTAQPALTVV